MRLMWSACVLLAASAFSPLLLYIVPILIFMAVGIALCMYLNLFRSHEDIPCTELI